MIEETQVPSESDLAEGYYDVPEVQSVDLTKSTHTIFHSSNVEKEEEK